MKPASAKVIVPFLLSLSGLYAQEAIQTGFDGSRGNLWFGGTAGFSSSRFVDEGEVLDDFSVNTFQVSPIIRFFPTKNFVLGPKVSYSRTTVRFDGENESISTIGTGMEIGFLYGQSKVKPYFLSSPQFTSVILDDEGTPGLSLPITGGVIIPVFENLGLQLECGYKFDRMDGEGVNSFILGFGFCGTGKKTAVSTMTSMSSSIMDSWFW